MLRVTLNELSRLPVERLAQLLMEWAIEDQRLLVRLHATLEANARRTAATDTGAAPMRQSDIIGQSAAMRHASEMIGRFARTDEPVLITGESGTGKELAARAIHDRSRRRDGPFVAVNCAAFPSALVASELFGYEKGAFTGAAARTKGQIEHANGGTLFLDEIGDMPVDLQGHLLRFLQEGQIVRVGGREAIQRRRAHRRRHQRAPAPGDRRGPFPRGPVLSAQHPVAGACRRCASGRMTSRCWRTMRSVRRPRISGREVTGFAPEAMEALRRHDWPGNVRELMAAVRRAVVIGDSSVVILDDLTGLGEPSQRTVATTVRPLPGSDAERTALLEALAGTQENITLTAQELGVSRVTLYRMLRRHSINLSRGLKAPPVAG